MEGRKKRGESRGGKGQKLARCVKSCPQLFHISKIYYENFYAKVFEPLAGVSEAGEKGLTCEKSSFFL